METTGYKVMKLMQFENQLLRLNRDVEKLVGIAAQHGAKIKELVQQNLHIVQNMKQEAKDEHSIMPATSEALFNDGRDAEMKQYKGQLSQLENELFQSNFKTSMDMKKMENEIKVSRKEFYEMKNYIITLEKKLEKFVKAVEDVGISTNVTFFDPSSNKPKAPAIRKSSFLIEFPDGAQPSPFNVVNASVVGVSKLEQVEDNDSGNDTDSDGNQAADQEPQKVAKEIKTPAIFSHETTNSDTKIASMHTTMREESITDISKVISNDKLRSVVSINQQKIDRRNFINDMNRDLHIDNVNAAASASYVTSQLIDQDFQESLSQKLSVPLRATKTFTDSLDENDIDCSGFDTSDRRIFDEADRKLIDVAFTTTKTQVAEEDIYDNYLKRTQYLLVKIGAIKGVEELARSTGSAGIVAGFSGVQDVLLQNVQRLFRTNQLKLSPEIHTDCDNDLLIDQVHRLRVKKSDLRRNIRLDQIDDDISLHDLEPHIESLTEQRTTHSTQDERILVTNKVTVDVDTPRKDVENKDNIISVAAFDNPENCHVEKEHGIVAIGQQLNETPRVLITKSDHLETTVHLQKVEGCDISNEIGEDAFLAKSMSHLEPISFTALNSVASVSSDTHDAGVMSAWSVDRKLQKVCAELNKRLENIDDHTKIVNNNCNMLHQKLEKFHANQNDISTRIDHLRKIQVAFADRIMEVGDTQRALIDPLNSAIDDLRTNIAGIEQFMRLVTAEISSLKKDRNEKEEEIGKGKSTRGLVMNNVDVTRQAHVIAVPSEFEAEHTIAQLRYYEKQFEVLNDKYEFVLSILSSFAEDSKRFPLMHKSAKEKITHLIMSRNRSSGTADSLTEQKKDLIRDATIYSSNDELVSRAKQVNVHDNAVGSYNKAVNMRDLSQKTTVESSLKSPVKNRKLVEFSPDQEHPVIASGIGVKKISPHAIPSLMNGRFLLRSAQRNISPLEEIDHKLRGEELAIENISSAKVHPPVIAQPIRSENTPTIDSRSAGSLEGDENRYKNIWFHDFAPWNDGKKD